jgi:hypothetical protein
MISTHAREDRDSGATKMEGPETAIPARAREDRDKGISIKAG